MLVPISVGDGLGKRHYQIIGWCCGARVRTCLLCIQQRREGLCIQQRGTRSHSETWTFSAPTMELMTFSIAGSLVLCSLLGALASPSEF